MEVLLQGLRAVVTQAEFAAGIGAEFPELYIVKLDGKIVKRKLLTLDREIFTKVDKLPIVKKDQLPDVNENIMGFLPNGEKVPYHHLQNIVSFFKKTMEGNKAAMNSRVQHSYEAMAHIVWNPEKQTYRVAIPTQYVQSAHVHYEFDHIEDGEEIIVDIHSHNTMGAFFSGTDNGDDANKIGFSGVVGQLNKPEPQLCWRFNDLETKVKVDLEDIFAMPIVEIPEEWEGKVTFGAKPGQYARGAAGGNVRQMPFGFNQGGKNRQLGKGNAAASDAGVNRNDAGFQPGINDDDLAGIAVDQMSDEQYAEWCAAFRGDDVDGLDMGAIRAFEEALLADPDRLAQLIAEEAEIDGIDISEIEYEIAEVAPEKDEELQALFEKTPNRTLGRPEPRIVSIDPLEVPDELDNIVEVFLAQIPEAGQVSDLFYDLSEYFLVEEDENEEPYIVVPGSEEVGFICPKILGPKEAMALVNNEGAFMIADYETGNYLVGQDMLVSVKDEEAELGISISEGRYLGPLRVREKNQVSH